MLLALLVFSLLPSGEFDSSDLPLSLSSSHSLSTESEESIWNDKQITLHRGHNIMCENEQKLRLQYLSKKKTRSYTLHRQLLYHQLYDFTNTKTQRKWKKNLNENTYLNFHFLLYLP